VRLLGPVVRLLAPAAAAAAAAAATSPQELAEGAAPRERGAQQAQRLPRPSRALQKRVLPLLQGLDHAVHVGDLAVVGIEGEVDIDAADAVDRHFAAAGGRGGGGRRCGGGNGGKLAREGVEECAPKRKRAFGR